MKRDGGGQGGRGGPRARPKAAVEARPVAQRCRQRPGGLVGASGGPEGAPKEGRLLGPAASCLDPSVPAGASPARPSAGLGLAEPAASPRPGCSWPWTRGAWELQGWLGAACVSRELRPLGIAAPGPSGDGFWV